MNRDDFTNKVIAAAKSTGYAFGNETDVRLAVGAIFDVFWPQWSKLVSEVARIHAEQAVDNRAHRLEAAKKSFIQELQEIN